MPAAIFVVTALALVVFVLLEHSELGVGDVERTGTDMASEQVPVNLMAGQSYFLYIDPNTTVPQHCQATGPNGVANPLTPTTTAAWAVTSPKTINGRSYRYAWTFTSPISGASVVRCTDYRGGSLAVTGDDTVYLWFFFVIAGSGLMLVIAAGCVFYIIMRRASSKRAHQPPRPTPHTPYRPYG